MSSKRKIFFLFSLLFIFKTYAGVEAHLNLKEPYDSDFNFHNKNAFLKDRIKELIECIQPSPGSTRILRPLPPEESLLKSSEGSRKGKDRFVFKYIGQRKYNETCLGDSYKKDLIRRLYDASCMRYEEKVNFLEVVSCNATQNLECRQVGVEPIRQFAEQATPVMRCLCPDYSKSQAYLADSFTGYFDKKRKQCVLKAGKMCKVEPRALDQRLEWNDFDYNENQDDVVEGIDVVDLRPIAKTYPCVNHAFCYTNDTNGLDIAEISKDRCVCEAGYFAGSDRECHLGRDPPTAKGLLLAFIMFSIGLLTFISVLLL